MYVDGREALEEAVAQGMGVGVIARTEFNEPRRIRNDFRVEDCQASMTEFASRGSPTAPHRTCWRRFLPSACRGARNKRRQEATRKKTAPEGAALPLLHGYFLTHRRR